MLFAAKLDIYIPIDYVYTESVRAKQLRLFLLGTAIFRVLFIKIVRSIFFFSLRFIPVSFHSLAITQAAGLLTAQLFIIPFIHANLRFEEPHAHHNRPDIFTVSSRAMLTFCFTWHIAPF